MKPLAEFPEVPEGLEREVYELYESTVEDKPDNMFSYYFARNMLQFGLTEDEAKRLDGAINALYGTFEAIKTTKTSGSHQPKRTLEYNLLSEIVAALGMADHGHVTNVAGTFREVVGVDVHYRTLATYVHELSARISSVFTFFISEATDYQEHIHRHFHGPPEPMQDLEFAQGSALTALDEKLRFEAAIYEGMKKHYGITVELPSPDTPPAA